ncbi:MAG: DNA sulfur modification protein DndE [Bacteroidales bacterium]|nr:DNA sulfur modification protein DndE [Bacteroidales bacterium]
MKDFSRIRFSKEASDALNKMKGRTGLTPNILCRLGFCLSLNDASIPNPDSYRSPGDREIDRKVLMGNEEDLYIALVKTRCVEAGIIEDEQIFEYFKAHMNRGILLLSKRVGNIKDLARLIPD